MNNKETILLATLELAAQKGLGNISLSQIAKKVGIQKPGLYSHFSSKEEIIESMYVYVRARAREKAGISVVDYGKLAAGKTAEEILTLVVNNYINMAERSDMAMFFQVIAAESGHDAVAAKIMLDETETMLSATKQLFYEMQEQKKLEFPNTAIAATIFAMTIHSLMDTVHDRMVSGLTKDELGENNPFTAFIKEFVRIYEVRQED